MSDQTRTIEIFRAGTHRTNAGREITFSEDDVTATAAAYDPKAHEAPAVVGHPQLDGPAYGWVKGLAAEGGKLKADVALTPAFAEVVAAGHFKKVSASFYTPDQAGNPKPGVYYLRHLGFLGAHPPAIKGLEAFQFADGVAEGLVEIELNVSFAEAEASDVTSIGRVVSRLIGIVGRLRDHVADQDGQEAADRIADGRELDWMREDTAEMVGRVSERMRVEGPPQFSEPDPQPEKPDMTDKTKDEEEAAARRSAEFAEREKTLAARETAIARQEIGSRLDQLVAGGKILPAEKDGLTAFAEKLDDGQAVAFAEGADAKTPREFFLGFLEGLPKRVDFGEIAGGANPIQAAGAFVAPAGFVVDRERQEIHEKAVAFAEQHKVDYITAVKAVENL